MTAAGAAAPGGRARRSWLGLAWRYAWPGIWTAAALLPAAAALATGAQMARIGGVWEVAGGSLLRRLPFGICAITVGHIVLGSDAAILSALRAHERAHVQQYERWGPLFVPAYLLASAWQWARGRHAYRDNPFEQQAWRFEESVAVAAGEAG